MADDEWMPESLSALLGMQPDDPGRNSAVSLAEAATHLMETRAISARRAQRIVKKGRCDECNCVLGMSVNPDVCECHCHCQCCCPPLFHCVTQCACQCTCHCAPNETDDEDEDTDVEAEQPTDHLTAGASSTTDLPTAKDEVVGESETSQASVSEAATKQTQGTDLKGNTNDGDADDARDQLKSATQQPVATGSMAGSDIGSRGDQQGSGSMQQGVTDDKAEDEDAQRNDDMSDDEGTAPGAGTATPSLDVDQQQGGSGTTAAGKMNDGEDVGSDDEMTGTAPIAQRLDQLQQHQLLVLLTQNLSRTNEQADVNSETVTAELFRQIYTTALEGAKPAKKTNNHLPALTPTETELLQAFLRTVITDQKYSAARTISALKDIAIAAARSTWTAERIIADRLASARLPREPPTNVWKQPDGETATSQRTGATVKYRFDLNVYSQEEIEKYQAVCIQEHVFAETTRAPSPDEWAVIMGLISGSIQAAATPQFLKRCCTLAHIAWMYEQIHATEGELWIRLPSKIKMFNYGQTTRRLAEAIRQSAVHQKWTDIRLETLLTAVKSIAYSKKLHAIHFYFFSKADAKNWEHMSIPFRAQQFKLVNPETKLRRSHINNSGGLPTDDDDGLVNDRYQAQYQLRLLNLVRSLPLRAIVAYLQRLTKNGLKSALPLDTYGQFAEGSLMWDFYGITAECPVELLEVYRVDWDGHMILLQHQPDSGQQPCLQCAQMGHQTSNCTTPEADWNNTTIKVTAAEIRELMPPAQPWKTVADVQAIFASLQAPSTTDTDTKKPEGAATDAPSQDSGANEAENSDTGSGIDNPGGHNNTANETTAAPISNTTILDPKGTNNAPNNPTNSLPLPPTGSTAPSKKQHGWQTAKRGKCKQNNSAGSKSKRDSHTPKDAAAGKGEPATAASPSTVNSSEQKNGTNTKGPTAQSKQHNSYINLADDEDDSDDSDYEDDKMESEQKKEPGPNRRDGLITTPVATTAEEENEAIERAIWQTRIEQIRADIRASAEAELPPFQLDLVRESIARARPNIGPKSSRSWLLEAINGRLTDTPGTGNCQSYAIMEAIAQRDLRDMDDPAGIIGSVTAFKYALYLTYLTTSTSDRKNTSAAFLLDLPAGLPTDLTNDQLHDLVKKHYQDLARSGSALNNALEERLWGTFDTIRTGALALDTPIFLMTQTSDPVHCGLNVFRTMKNARGEIFVSMSQPGTEGWLTELEVEATKTNAAPIVLSHNTKHYNCVIFDRHKPANNRQVTKKLKTPILSDLWQQTSLDAIIDDAQAAAKKQQPRNMSRRAVLASDAKVTAADLISFLSDDGWSVEEKSEIVDILVAGATNYRELLTFSTTSPGSEGAETPSESTQGEVSLGSEYDPANMSDGGQESSQAFSLPSQGTEDYQAWAESLWEPVRESWMEQHYVMLPALDNQAGLRRWIDQLPEDLLEAGRWCPNPFALLDHLPRDFLQDLMTPYWLRYCAAQLAPHVATIPDISKRTILLDWLATLTQVEKAAVQQKRMKDAEKWAVLKDALPHTVTGATAIPFLSKKQTPKATYLLVLDQLFPSLARLALEESGSELATEKATIIDAFAHAPAFTTAMNKAVKNGRCPPVGIKGTAQDIPSTRSTSKDVQIGPWLNSFFDPAHRGTEGRGPDKFPTNSTFGVLTQNVRGFKQPDYNQEAWMAGWKATIDGNKLHVIALQETHVDSAQAAAEMALKWCRQWGKSPDPARPMSYWSITGSKVGGVALLLHPRVLEEGWQWVGDEEDGGRCLIIETPETRIINVYAPNKRGERERFFTWLDGRLGQQRKRTLLVGDFNCVLDNGADRVTAGRWGPGRNESPQLQQLLDRHQPTSTRSALDWAER